MRLRSSGIQYYSVRKTPGGPGHCFAVRRQYLEPLVISKIVEILDAPGLERRLREAIVKRVRSAKKASADCKSIRRRIAALDKKIAKGVERLLLLDGEDLADASTVLADWRSQRRQLVEQLDSLDVPSNASPERETARVAAELANLRRTFQSADPATLRAALATVIEDITLYWEPGGPRKWRFKRGVIRFGDKLQVALTSATRGLGMMEILLFLAFLVLWFVLQAWILPRFGVST